MKQEVQAKAQRFRRYEKRKNQYTQNKMLKNDTKIFYTNLGMKKKNIYIYIYIYI